MTDDLDVVRRLGALLAAETPDAAAARARVRTRVTVTPSAQRPRDWRRFVPLAGAVAAVAAIIAIAVLRAGSAEHDQHSFSSRPKPVAQAPSLFPQPDQFLYVRSRGAYLACSMDGPHPGCKMQPQRTREIWISESGQGRLLESGSKPTALSRSRLYIGNRAFTHAQLATYAPTPQDLLAELKAGRQPGQGGNTRSYAYIQITDALREAAAPPAVRLALIGALPLVPGVHDDGEVTDSAGRAGHAYSVTDHGSRKTVIVDPVSLTMLQERDVLLNPKSLGVSTRLRAGDIVGGAIYLQRAVVGKAGVRP
jgi:hypothetical protein